MGFLQDDTTNQSFLQDKGNTSFLNDAPVASSQPQEDGFQLGKGAAGAIKEPGRAVEGVVDTVKTQARNVGEFLGAMFTGKNARMEAAFADYRAGKLPEADYRKMVNDYDTPLWDVGSFLIGSMTGAKASQIAPAAMTMVGAGLPTVSGAMAQTPEEFGANTFNTAEMFALGMTAGKYELGFWNKVTGLPTTFKGIRLADAAKGQVRPKVELDVNLAKPETKVALDLAKRTGGATVQQKALLDSVAAGTPQKRVIIDPDALNDIPVKNAVLRNIDYTQAQDPVSLTKQIYVKAKPKQMDLFDEDIVKTSAVAAKELWSDPDFQAVRELYDPNNQSKNFFKVYNDTAVAKATGTSAVGTKVFNAKSKAAMAVSNSGTTAEVLGPSAKGMHDQLIRIDKARLDLKDAWLNTYLGRIATMRGNEWKLPTKGDPLQLNQAERIELWVRLHNTSEHKLLPKQVFSAEARDYYMNPDGTPKNFLSPQEFQQASTGLALTRNTRGRVLEAGKNITGVAKKSEGDFYLPRSYDKDAGLPGDVVDDLVARMGAAVDGMSLEEALVKSRTNVKQGTLKLNFYDSIEKYINQASRLIAVSEGGGKDVVRRMQLTNPHIEKQFGGEAARMWRDQVKVWLCGQDPAKTQAEKLLHGATRMGTEIAISVNPVKLAATQYGGLIPVVGQVGPKWTTVGIRSAMTREGQAILMQDAHFRGRVMDPNLERINVLNSYGRGKADIPAQVMNSVKGAWTILPRFSDVRVAGAAYLAGYKKWLYTHPGDIAGAQLEGTRVLSATQGMSQAQFRPYIQQNNVVGKAFTAFQSQQAAQNNAMMRSWVDFKNGQIDGGQLTQQYLTNIFLPALYQSTIDIGTLMVQESLGGGSDVEIADKVSQSLLTGQAQQIFMFGGWLSGMRYNNGKLNVPAGKPLEIAFKTGMSWQQAFENEEFTNALVDSAEAYFALKHGIDFKVPATFLKDYLGE